MIMMGQHVEGFSGLLKVVGNELQRFCGFQLASSREKQRDITEHPHQGFNETPAFEVMAQAVAMSYD